MNACPCCGGAGVLGEREQAGWDLTVAKATAVDVMRQTLSMAAGGADPDLAGDRAGEGVAHLTDAQQAVVAEILQDVTSLFTR